ncbi:hypothetical protein [Nocardioides massiliensis]|uniref:Uncharacterized protein n=1 Tax=Nocardioides massiliensis TaxID=1325935 RepID=A0ABT9NII3_9ACTN|nr:hypothetical protein [Nocardioides massiliensis]MDP9820223.1 hypothetical protein [Nocardioides massiliensis]
MDELTHRSPRVCPRRLPRQDDPGHGFGPEGHAQIAPLLATPERAWVCRYAAVDVGPHPDGQGRTFGWQQRGRARAVGPDRMSALTGQLARLAPPATAQPERVCTADLGERWMLVYAIGTDLTGVVADDFSCGDIRLTDDPFRTAPGEATQPGTVAGVLEAPGFVGLLKSAWTDARS